MIVVMVKGFVVWEGGSYEEAKNAVKEIPDGKIFNLNASMNTPIDRLWKWNSIKGYFESH